MEWEKAAERTHIWFQHSHQIGYPVRALFTKNFIIGQSSAHSVTAQTEQIEVRVLGRVALCKELPVSKCKRKRASTSCGGHHVQHGSDGPRRESRENALKVCSGVCCGVQVSKVRRVNAGRHHTSSRQVPLADKGEVGEGALLVPNTLKRAASSVPGPPSPGWRSWRCRALTSRTKLSALAAVLAGRLVVIKSQGGHGMSQSLLIQCQQQKRPSLILVCCVLEL